MFDHCAFEAWMMMEIMKQKFHSSFELQSECWVMNFSDDLQVHFMKQKIKSADD
jgi:hypothetical protein